MPNLNLISGVILGVVLSLGAFLLVGKAEAQSRALGPYMIMGHSNQTASPGVFRVNQSTGYTSYCYVSTSGGSSVICTTEVP